MCGTGKKVCIDDERKYRMEKEIADALTRDLIKLMKEYPKLNLCVVNEFCRRKLQLNDANVDDYWVLNEDGDYVPRV